MPSTHDSGAISTLSENLVGTSTAADYSKNYGEGGQASNSDFQSTQSQAPQSQKKNWQRDRNKRGFERRPDHRDGPTRVNEGVFERRAEPRDHNRMMEHQPYDQVRGRYPENDYRQKKWPAPGRENFNRRPESGHQERPQRESHYTREEYRPRDDVDHSKEYVGQDGSLAANQRDVDNERKFESGQASLRYDKKPQRFRGKAGGFSEVPEYTQRQYESYRDRRKPLPAKPKDNGSVADSATQLERLTHQLTNGNYECMVCYEPVKQAQVRDYFFFQFETSRLILVFALTVNLELRSVLSCFPSPVHPTLG